tara:strand:- start:33 stop:1163 length:1131 start_codon:yes stop_codon:yes gene_type:complete
VEDNKQAYIASQYKPKPTQPGPPGSGPGSQGNVNTNPANDWIGNSQNTNVYYGNLPQSQGNTNVNVSNPSGGNYQGPPVTPGGDGGNGAGTDTGSGSSGGSGSGAAGSGMSGTELAALANAITGSNILGGGITKLTDLSQDTLSQSDAQTQQNLDNLDTVNPSENWRDKFQLLGGNDSTGWQYNITDPGKLGYNINDNMGITANVDPFKGTGNLGFNMSFADGGPVGLMSLPQGYAAGGEVDPSDWRVIQQIIAAGGNPEDYVYANGGEVVEESETLEEYKPFGGTRERVIDQVEAFDNAPHHIEEPMIGMYGEKVPLSIARRVQKYMEGLDPVKRGLIQETLDMFQNKKMHEKMQKMEEDSQGGYFGPQPKEYDI